MKKIRYILILLCMYSCSNEDAWDCLQNAGTTITQSYNVTGFERILVNRNVTLIISEGSNYEVIVETGENLINDVVVEQVGDELQLSDSNNCNYIREFGVTKVYVTTPILTEIRNSSQFEVQSQGVLTFPVLKLFSEDFLQPGSLNIGDFRLEVNNNRVAITSNNISTFHISGSTNNLRVGFFAGEGRFEGRDLLANNVNIYHRGSNDIIVNPIDQLVGEIVGTGDVISVNTPPVVDVDEVYIGRLIFED